MRQSALDHRIAISAINRREAWGYQIRACNKINIGECDGWRKAASLEVIPSLFFSSEGTPLTRVVDCCGYRASSVVRRELGSKLANMTIG